MSQTDTKIDVLKDSNIDLVSLLTNKDNLIRDISHSCYNKPRIPSTIQHISSEECMMTNNKKNSEAEIELRPTQFFRDNTQHKKTFTEQTRGQCQRPQSSRTNMRSQKTRNYQPRTQYEEKNHHSRNNKQYNVNSKRHYSPQLYTKENTNSAYNTHEIGHPRNYNRAPSRTYRHPGPHYSTRIFHNSRYNHNVSVNYSYTSDSYYETQNHNQP
ncbi:hypothetical protein JTB14_010299 [Gonioctena quinquepunctata]|nr:hypothetical protein JTB14_010299 [Gonioctena quinquepunctata]